METRVKHALSELERARQQLDVLEQDQLALADRLAAARKAQRRITYYLVALLVAFALLVALLVGWSA